MRQLLGRKVGMTRIYDDAGNETPVTVIEVQPHVVIGRRTESKNGYDAVVVGVGDDTRSKIPRQIAGQYPDGVDTKRVIRELQVEDEYDVGQTIDATLFQPGDEVKVTGRTRGKGFAGVMKRHGFSGGPSTHGSMNHRLPGSIGQSADPSRVFKGTRMGGRMGGGNTTVKGLRIVEVDAERNLLVISGSVPGWRGCLLTITSDKRGK